MTATTIIQNRLGVGLYSIPEAARLLRVSPQLVRRWIDPQDGLIHRVFSPDEMAISFVELMELHFVQMFRGEGVSLQTIRSAAKTAGRQFNCPHPFTLHRFDTDGRDIFATLLHSEKRKALIEDLKHGQYVFDSIVRPFFKKLEYNQDDAIRFWPLNKTGRVVLDPQRHFGKPIECAVLAYRQKHFTLPSRLATIRRP